LIVAADGETGAARLLATSLKAGQGPFPPPRLARERAAAAPRWRQSPSGERRPAVEARWRGSAAPVAGDDARRRAPSIIVGFADRLNAIGPLRPTPSVRSA